MKYINLILGSLILTAMSASCQNFLNNNSQDMGVKPNKFTNVQIDSPEENPCSPPEPDEFGISINIPSEITLSIADKENGVVPLCGVYHLSLTTLEKHPEPLMIHLRHIESDATFSGAILDNDPSPDAPEPEPEFLVDEPEPDIGDMSIVTYFNPNILNHIDFPLLPGYYEVFVEYAEQKSNTKNIKVNLK